MTRAAAWALVCLSILLVLVAPRLAWASSPGEPPLLIQARPSPKGDRLALTLLRMANRSVPTHAALGLAPALGGPLHMLSAPPFNSWGPQWTPDGRAILFLSDRLGTPQLFLLRMEGPGEAEPLSNQRGGVQTFLLSPSGRQVAWLAPDTSPPEHSARPTWTPLPVCSSSGGRSQLWVATLGKEGEVGVPHPVQSHLRWEPPEPLGMGPEQRPFAWLTVGKADALVSCQAGEEGITEVALVHPRRLIPPTPVHLPFTALGVQGESSGSDPLVYGVDSQGRSHAAAALVFKGIMRESALGGDFGNPSEQVWPLGERRWVRAGGGGLHVVWDDSVSVVPLPVGACSVTDLQPFPKGDALLVTFLAADGSSHVGRVRLNRPVYQQLLSLGVPQAAQPLIRPIRGSQGQTLAWLVQPAQGPATKPGQTVPPAPEAVWMGHSLGAAVPTALLARVLVASGRALLALPGGGSAWEQPQVEELLRQRSAPEAWVWLGSAPPPAAVGVREGQNSAGCRGYWITWNAGEERTLDSPLCPPSLNGCFSALVGASGFPDLEAFKALLTLPGIRMGLGAYP